MSRVVLARKQSYLNNFHYFKHSHFHIQNANICRHSFAVNINNNGLSFSQNKNYKHKFLNGNYIIHRTYCKENEKTNQQQNDNNNEQENQSKKNNLDYDVDFDDIDENNVEILKQKNAEIQAHQAQITQLETEMKKYREALQRSKADLMNIEHFHKKDLDNIKNSALRKFSKDLLIVADAIKAAVREFDEKKIEPDKLSQIKPLIEGIKLTEKSLMDTFAKNGIKQIEALGCQFDPQVHEALFQQPHDKHEPNTVIQVLADGYCLHDHVLRPARVGVSIEMVNSDKNSDENTNNDGSNDNDNNSK